jgi:hypothetical protein
MIALELGKAGFVSHTGRRFAATAVGRMLVELCRSLLLNSVAMQIRSCCTCTRPWRKKNGD